MWNYQFTQVKDTNGVNKDKAIDVQDDDIMEASSFI